MALGYSGAISDAFWETLFETWLDILIWELAADGGLEAAMIEFLGSEAGLGSVHFDYTSYSILNPSGLLNVYSIAYGLIGISEKTLELLC